MCTMQACLANTHLTSCNLPLSQCPQDKSHTSSLCCMCMHVPQNAEKPFHTQRDSRHKTCHSADVHALDSVINERTLTLCCNATYACPLPSPAHSLLQAMLTLSPFKRSCRPTRGHLHSHRDSEQTTLYSVSPHQQPE